MSEGSLEAPIRHPLDWHSEEFYDPDKIDAELRRVFDICHGCRRCFNLCNSFPRLFDLIDESETGELDSVDSKDFGPVVDDCTLCDMCFMTKCPYVPPHEFNLDFPHLMLRYRAAQYRKKGVGFFDEQIARTDRNGKLGTMAPRLANWATRRDNTLTRPAMEKIAGIDRRAKLPPFNSPTFERRAAREHPPVNADAPAYGRKAVIYATCFVNYNNPLTGEAALRVLAKNGVDCVHAYPECCGMPQLEHGDIETVAAKARHIARALMPYIEEGRTIISLTPSCSLMLKFEYPLLLPGDPDIARLAGAVQDISEYMMDIAKNEGLAEGMKPLSGPVAMHLACHSRAQNMGPKGAELLRQIPQAKVQVIERCSGHGGSWGVKKKFFDTAIKVGKPVARQALKTVKAAPDTAHVVSECPLAGEHILQGMEMLEAEAPLPQHSRHPIELIARAYGLLDDE